MELLLICYIGSAISLAPHVLPPSIAIFLAASASETQVLLPIGMMFLFPTLVAYSACSYWILFWGAGSAGKGLEPSPIRLHSLNSGRGSGTRLGYRARRRS
jgi:cytochrome bd-type quinol oxidase subunit 2